MEYVAYVQTKDVDSLTVRNAPLGEKIEFIGNGTKVKVQGKPVAKGNWNWVQIGSNRWVASEFLQVIKGAKVVATRTNETIAGGLRVYKTILVDSNGKIVNKVRLISGRVNYQNPSDVEDSLTPPPFGIYTFDAPGWVYKGKDLKAQFGGVWSPITPTFNTNRSEIGIHYDPSASKGNYNAGTVGCFATPTVKEKDIMTNFIQTHKPKHFIFNDG
jgi:hypothetical protein